MTNSNAENPYASPLSDAAPAARSPASPTESARLRRDYLKHEAAIRSLGIFQMLFAAALAIATLAMPFLAQGTSPAQLALIALGLLIGEAIIFFVARGIRLLQPWARIAEMVLLSLNFPAAVLANQLNPVMLSFIGVLIYWLGNAKGRMVFSERYRQAIAETPHITYRTARWVWVVVGIVVVVSVFAGLVMSRRH